MLYVQIYYNLHFIYNIMYICINSLYYIRKLKIISIVQKAQARIFFYFSLYVYKIVNYPSFK